MLILNQNKNKIFNANNLRAIYVENNSIWIKTNNNSIHYLIGEYKDNMEATEVLCDIFRSNGNFAMPKMGE